MKRKDIRVWTLLMEKTEGQKSVATVPLNLFSHILLNIWPIQKCINHCNLKICVLYCTNRKNCIPRSTATLQIQRGQCYSRMEIPGIQSRIKTWIFLFERQTMKWEWKQRIEKNKSRTKNKWKSNDQKKKLTTIIRTSNNNENNARFNWHMNVMHNINKSRVSLFE
jgi:hypothetical protein